jgi:ribosomal 50S subunit-recycling heat shock protein
VDEMIGKIQSNQSNQWIAKLIYSCKVGDVMKIVVPTKEEVARVTQISRYYAKKKDMSIVYRTEKIWRGINLFLSVAKNGK